VPMTYRARNGKQYVVIAAAGTNRFRMIANTADETADSLIAFTIGGKEEGPTVSPRMTTAVKAVGGPLAEGEGQAAVVKMCTTCHGASVFTGMRMSRDAWSAEVAAMVEKGAKGTAAEIGAVVEYLSKNYGK
ncbi:MAG: quinoprotein glucose dehydrogenase, partial [Candidatus Solibacter sp.]|nr:quinoprotein glucose dehydrogenase [Candidatus Solibacter sp.]